MDEVKNPLDMTKFAEGVKKEAQSWFNKFQHPNLIIVEWKASTEDGVFRMNSNTSCIRVENFDRMIGLEFELKKDKKSSHDGKFRRSLNLDFKISGGGGDQIVLSYNVSWRDNNSPNWSEGDPEVVKKVYKDILNIANTVDTLLNDRRSVLD